MTAEDKLDYVIKRLLKIEERLEAIEKNLDALFKAYKRLQNEELKEIREYLDALDDDIEEIKEWARDEYEVREIAHQVAEKVVREMVREEALYG
ncbi:MAG: hypothetical protein JRD89_12415 [Deltaproteobacteria bacterium]|nr:hypothetical protein [Deltaproteobacteria bacterium]